MQKGEPLSPAALRTNELLRNEEWKVFDTEIVEGAKERLRAVADLLVAGLSKTIPNGLAKTVLQYDKVGDMDDAIVSMDGINRSENDRIEYESAGLPLPITHKDFYLNLRALLASRTGSEPMDTTYIRVAGRKVGEKSEDMLFNGGKAFGGLNIYGFRTHPDRNVVAFGAGGNWAQTAKTGPQVIADVFSGIKALQADGFNGPYWIYIGGTAASLKLSEDYKDGYDKTIRERIDDIEEISRIATVDKLASGEVIMFQPTKDVVEMIEGESTQTIQWDSHGGMQVEFKAFNILVPLIRSNADHGSGIAHFA
jgi:uncharacterized linocin/CFP29 family protein